MKRMLLIIISALISIAILSGCSAKNKIEDREWIMTIAQNDTGIVAHHPSESIEFGNNTASVPTELICSADDGKLTLTDKTNGKTYQGSYEKLDDEEDERVNYSVRIGNTDGTAIITTASSLDGEEYFNLIIVVGSYAINFKAK